MIRTVYIPNSNFISLPIPDKYVGMELEITVFPIKEISPAKSKSKKNRKDAIDPSFGAWADMTKSTEEICTDIRSSRTFRKRELAL
jgi:hypothetical protein